jgi:hypothetical protein
MSLQKKIVPNKVLITGASGLLGVAAAETLSFCRSICGMRKRPASRSNR